MALIHIDNICVAYGSPSRPVLSNINLSIAAGEFVCLLGQTGSENPRFYGSSLVRNSQPPVAS
jgi:ABC-type multidrug transport system fused ATPase/permease subunit